MWFLYNWRRKKNRIKQHWKKYIFISVFELLTLKTMNNSSCSISLKSSMNILVEYVTYITQLKLILTNKFKGFYIKNKDKRRNYWTLIDSGNSIFEPYLQHRFKVLRWLILLLLDVIMTPESFKRWFFSCKRKSNLNSLTSKNMSWQKET